MTWTRAGAVGTFTLDRPAARNALDLATIDALSAALWANEADADLRVVVITGAGSKAFCSGADLAGLAGSPDDRRLAGRRYAELLGQILNYPRPVVARVNGACMAGGWGLMLACDLAIATETATFALPEVNVGMWPMMVGALLVPIVGRRVALDLAMTARKIDAAEALRLGIVNRVVPDLDRGTDDLVSSLLSVSPTALRLGRRAWADAAHKPLEHGLTLLAERLGDLMETDDAAEGFVAFLEKRAPAWKDR